MNKAPVVCPILWNLALTGLNLKGDLVLGCKDDWEERGRGLALLRGRVSIVPWGSMHWEGPERWLVPIYASGWSCSLRWHGRAQCPPPTGPGPSMGVGHGSWAQKDEQDFNRQQWWEASETEGAAGAKGRGRKPRACAETLSCPVGLHLTWGMREKPSVFNSPLHSLWGQQ